MMRRPDEDQDVIVHPFRERDGQDIWTIWFAGDKKGARVTLESALELARAVAAVYSRPAWLLDETGYPLKPIKSPAESAH